MFLVYEDDMNKLMEMTIQGYYWSQSEKTYVPVRVSPIIQGFFAYRSRGGRPIACGQRTYCDANSETFEKLIAPYSAHGKESVGKAAAGYPGGLS